MVHKIYPKCAPGILPKFKKWVKCSFHFLRGCWIIGPSKQTKNFSIKNQRFLNWFGYIENNTYTKSKSSVNFYIKIWLITYPKRLNLGILLPTTPPTALPEWIPIRGKILGNKDDSSRIWRIFLINAKDSRAISEACWFPFSRGIPETTMYLSLIVSTL